MYGSTQRNAREICRGKEEDKQDNKEITSLQIENSTYWRGMLFVTQWVQVQVDTCRARLYCSPHLDKNTQVTKYMVTGIPCAFVQQ